MKSIVLHTQATEQSGVVIEDRQIIEYVWTRPEVATLSGSIFVGKVTRIDRGLKAAFIDIGENKQAFLRQEEIPWGGKSIEESIKEGEALIVQATRDPVGDKGAQVTADITVPGIYAIYQPFGRRVTVSRKLAPEYRDIWKAEIEQTLTENEGCIIRTAASEVEITSVFHDIQSLKDYWLQITAQAINGKPGVIGKDELLPDQLVRKYPASAIDQIITDDVVSSRYLKRRYPPLSDRVIWRKDLTDSMPVPINELQNQIVQSKVDLDNGAQVIIESTEAMTVVDVNSHKHKGKAMSNSQAFEVNKQAAREIQKQIQVRNIAGMVLIDFISMKSTKSEQRLVDFMKKQMKRDSVKSNVLGMTRLGLMEITRKREWPSPVEHLIQPTHPTFTIESRIYRLERELLLRKRTHAEAYLIAVHPRLLDVKKRLLSYSISSKIPQELFVRQDAAILGYQIELEGSFDMIQEAIQRRGYHVDNLF